MSAKINRRPNFGDRPRAAGEPRQAPQQAWCFDSRHYPPQGLYVPEGLRYHHKCPSCGHEAFIQGPTPMIP